MADSIAAASRARLRDLGVDLLVDALEALPDACTLSSAVRDGQGRARDMRLMWMNEAARRGQPDAEGAIGGLCSVLWPPMVTNGSFAACLRVLDTGVPVEGEFDWTESSAYRVAGYDYRARRLGQDVLLWVLRDNTERVRRTIDEAKQRELLERQLQQSQKMEVVGRLAAGVAHDFNNLITVMLGSCAELAPLLAPGSPGEEHLQDMSDAAQRAAGLTRRLLAFSRQQVERPTNLELDHLVRDLGHLLRRLLGETIELVLDLAPEGSVVHGDRGLLEQAVVNLVVNARDAMPNGGRITLETRNVTTERGPMVRLSVIDTGTGMEPSVQARLFEPFFTTKAPGRGTGLGLAMVRSVVEACRGHIVVHTAPGTGSRFELSFPRATAATRMATPEAPALRRSRGEVVLLAEDEPAVRTLTARILGRFGYEVLAASTGDEAEELSRTSTRPIHALITDVVLPKMSGPELAERVRSTRPDLRVLFVSGYTDDAVLRSGTLPEGTAFLAKPFQAIELVSSLGALLDA